MFKRFVLPSAFIIFALAMLGFAMPAFAAPAVALSTLTWTDPTTDMSGNPVTITGHNLYCASTSAGVPTATPVSLTTTATGTAAFPTNLPDGANYCGMTAIAGTVEGVLSNVIEVGCKSGTCFLTGTPGPGTGFAAH